MKLSEIINLEPGQVLNKLVHHVVFCKLFSDIVDQKDIPDYSGDIGLAWKVFDVIRSGKTITITANKDWFLCQIIKGNDYIGESYGESAPLAICRAAIIAILKERGELEK